MKDEGEKKYTTKTISALLCLSLVCSCIMPIYAADAIEDDAAEITMEQYIDYANSILPDLASLSDTDLFADGLYISQPIELLNDKQEFKCFHLFDPERLYLYKMVSVGLFIACGVTVRFMFRGWE